MGKSRLWKRVGQVVEGVFYLLLVSCLLLSIFVTIRSFVQTSDTVTSFSLHTVSEHVFPAIVYFGVGYRLSVCRKFRMEVGANDFTEMLKEGGGCTQSTFDLTFDAEHVLYFDELGFGDTDIGRMVGSIAKAKRPRNMDPGAEGARDQVGNLSLSIIVVRGPRLWQSQDAVYVRVSSPKAGNMLHPYYLMSEFSAIRSKVAQIAKKSEEGDPIGAMQQLEGMIKDEGAVFRYLPTGTLSVISMFKEQFLQDGVLARSRITVEQTSADIYDVDCDHWRDRDGISTDSQPGENTSAGSGGAASLLDVAPLPLPGASTSESSSDYSSYYDYQPEDYVGYGMFRADDDPYEEETFWKEICGQDGSWVATSEAAFRWFDGLVKESNTYDSFDPWAVFTTLVSVILGLDRLYITLKRYYLNLKVAPKIPLKTVTPEPVPRKS